MALSRPPSFDRVAVVHGLRTPFAKRNTAYRNLSARTLGMHAVRELLDAAALNPADLDALIFGQVVPDVQAPNVAREIVLGLDLGATVDAHSVSRACATSTQAVATAAMMIETGHAQVVVAGGADSMSHVPLTVKKPLADALARASSATKALDKIRAFQGISAADLLPDPPSLTERSTGLSMGESAEQMAQKNGISRREQDAFAHRSHQRAAEANSNGVFQEEVFHMYVPPGFEAFHRDNLIRFDSDPAKYSHVAPAFDPEFGTVTAANSSALTDGAAALLLMREDAAKALGHEPLAYIRSFAFAALDPADQLLMGPAYAIPKALDRAGLKLSDMTLVDLHEAFAAQVLSNLQALASDRFATEQLGRSEAVGEVDGDRLNVHGGSIAIGHPFAATGARQLNTLARELRRRGGGFGLVAQCAAGGLGAAVVLEA